MKKVARNFMMLLLALLYSCLISSYGSVLVIDVVESQHAAELSHHLATTDSVLYCHRIASQTMSSIVPTLPHPVDPTSETQSTLALLCEARLLNASFSSYSFYSDYQIFRLEKPDIVFPFHTFL